MSDDLRERVAAIADKITHAMDQGVEDGYVEEMIAMFKQDAVEAVKDEVDSLGWVDIDAAIKAINQL